jgi:flavin-dependent dehydrogenase
MNAPNAWGCCPRRLDLDRILLDGARAAGAEVRLRCKVVDVIRDKDRVVGVVVEENDQKHELRANIVVGADGRSSTIAALVGAEEYFAYDGPRAGYWSYWPRPSWYTDDPRFHGGALIVYEGPYARFVFPTNRDQLCIGATFPRDDLDRWKADPKARLEQVLRESQHTAPLIDGAEPLEKVRGIIKVRYFFRRAVGPGWALCGDAGLHKDPHAGNGISDALADARSLADAILDGSDAALERHWRQRDVNSWELFNFTRDLGELDYNSALNQTLFAQLAANPELHARLVGVVERTLSPYTAFSPGELIKWTLGALVRGRFGVLPRFFKAARRAMQIAKELERRRKLLTPALPARPAETDRAAA